jgi:hypothetical protein
MTEIKFDKLMVKHATVTGKTPIKVEFYGGVELIVTDPNAELAQMLLEGHQESGTFEVTVRRVGRGMYPLQDKK